MYIVSGLLGKFFVNNFILHGDFLLPLDITVPYYLSATYEQATIYSYDID